MYSESKPKEEGKQQKKETTKRSYGCAFEGCGRKFTQVLITNI